MRKRLAPSERMRKRLARGAGGSLLLAASLAVPKCPACIPLWGGLMALLGWRLGPAPLLAGGGVLLLLTGVFAGRARCRSCRQMSRS